MFKITGSGPYCAVSYDSSTFADLLFYMSEMGLHLDRQDPDDFLQVRPTSTTQYINLVTKFPLRHKICQHLDNNSLNRFSFFGSYIPKLENINNGVFIYPGVNVYPSAKIQPDVIIHSGSSIAHKATIGQGTYISGHVVIAGNTAVGKYCWIGLDVSILDKIYIADHVTINSRALVIKNIENQHTIYSKHIKR